MSGCENDQLLAPSFRMKYIEQKVRKNYEEYLRKKGRSVFRIVHIRASLTCHD